MRVKELKQLLETWDNVRVQDNAEVIILGNNRAFFEAEIKDVSVCGIDQSDEEVFLIHT